MKRIKIISAPGLESLQKYIDKWIDEKEPNIESVSSITSNPNSLTHVYMVTILYDEGVYLGGE